MTRAERQRGWTAGAVCAALLAAVPCVVQAEVRLTGDGRGGIAGSDPDSRWLAVTRPMDPRDHACRIRWPQDGFCDGTDPTWRSFTDHAVPLSMGELAGGDARR